MKKHTLALSLCALFALAACNGKPQDTTPVASEIASVAPASEAAEASAAVDNQGQALTSSDGQVVVTTSGTFADKSADAAFLPAETKAEDVLLLQHDESRNLTIYAVKAGQAKKSAEEFLANLKKTIESNKNLSNVSVGEAANGQLAYAYSVAGEPVVNESCIVAVAADKNLTTVCANSNDLSVDELKAVLSDVKFGG